MVLRYDVADYIATITLNRPEVMNALTRELYGELEQAFRRAHAVPSGLACVSGQRLASVYAPQICSRQRKRDA